MRVHILRGLSALVLILAIIWFFVDRSLEPMITAVLGLAGLLSAGLAEGGTQIAGSATGKKGQVPSLSADTGRSIAVLPFQNLSPDPKDAYFGDGLTEELITDLSKLKHLRVISRTSAMSFKGSQKDAPTIAKGLNVRYVLEGSVRKAGESLRITAQLIDALSDSHLWAEKYSGTINDVFDLQEQLSRRIIEALKISISPEDDRRLSARRIPDPRAYEHYLRARSNIYAFDAPSVDLAKRDLNAGLEILGENVDLLKGLGMALFQQLNAGLSEDQGIVDEVDACALRIKAIAPEDPSSFLIAGLGQGLRGDFPGAVLELREAYRRDPSDTDTLLWLGVSSLSTGQMDFAGGLVRELHRTDPLAPLSPLLVSYHAYFQGQFGRAAKLHEESLKLGPEVLVSLWQAVRTFIAAGLVSRAGECLESLREIDARSPFTESAGLLTLGLGDQAPSMPEPSPELRIWAIRDGEWAQYVSDAYAVGGDVERALEWLELARTGGFFNHEYLADHDPFVNELRGLEEWKAAIDQVRKSHAEFEARLNPL